MISYPTAWCNMKKPGMYCMPSHDLHVSKHNMLAVNNIRCNDWTRIISNLLCHINATYLSCCHITCQNPPDGKRRSFKNQTCFMPPLDIAIRSQTTCTTTVVHEPKPPIISRDVSPFGTNLCPRNIPCTIEHSSTREVRDQRSILEVRHVFQIMVIICWCPDNLISSRFRITSMR
jgi:hypothetical protein